MTVDLVSLTENILNGKRYFLCSVSLQTETDGPLQLSVNFSKCTNQINPFSTNGPLPDPLKTLVNLMLFYVLRRYRSVTLFENGLKKDEEY